MVVGDMPFMSYQTGWQDAMRNAARFMQEAGCGAVKLEGGVRSAEIVQKLVEAGIPVMGHIGLTPQSVNQVGGWKVQGKTPAAAVQLMHDAQALEQAGAFAIVLELVPAPLAELLTERLSVPTIGIGAGVGCDGQVQVFHDLLGLYDDFIAEARRPLRRRRRRRSATPSRATPPMCGPARSRRRSRASRWIPPRSPSCGPPGHRRDRPPPRARPRCLTA